MKDLMVDIETLATGPTAAIFAIGAVAFDLRTGKLAADRLRLVIDGTTIPADRARDPETARWWCKQDPMLVDALFRPGDDGLEYGVALDKLDPALRRADRVWAKPPAFDLVILRSAYEALGRRVPWHRRAECCARTLLGVGRSLGLPPPPEPTVKHDPLADAVAQAEGVCAVYRALQQRGRG